MYFLRKLWQGFLYLHMKTLEQFILRLGRNESGINTDLRFAIGRSKAVLQLPTLLMFVCVSLSLNVIHCI